MLSTVLSVILAIIGVILCIAVLLQSNRSAGLGAVSAASSDSYWSKNKGNSMEGSLARITKILGAAFMIIALVISFI
ncbi:MAG TPA: preprotein translocase subunit SecG [Firmicutes bacterium]|nr:preprotein translocase subunit SecG [Bacillota bacterium]